MNRQRGHHVGVVIDYVDTNRKVVDFADTVPANSTTTQTSCLESQQSTIMLTRFQRQGHTFFAKIFAKRQISPNHFCLLIYCREEVEVQLFDKPVENLVTLCLQGNEVINFILHFLTTFLWDFYGKNKFSLIQNYSFLCFYFVNFFC